MIRHHYYMNQRFTRDYDRAYWEFYLSTQSSSIVTLKDIKSN